MRQNDKSEQDLADHLHFMQTLIDSIASPVFYKDSQGVYRGCNKAFERYTGKAASDIIGKSVYDVSPRDLAEIYDRMDRELMKKGLPQYYETAVVDASGEQRNVLFNKAVYYDRNGQVGGIVGVIVDITERKRNEELGQKMQAQLRLEVEKRTEALRLTNSQLQRRNSELKLLAAELASSEEKFSKAFRYCSEVIGIIGLRERRVMEINEAFFRIFGYERDEILGCLVSEINIWDDPQDSQQVYQKMLEQESFSDRETTWRCKNGERRIGLHSGECIELDGEPCALFVWHDITERKLAEQALEKVNAELEAKVAKRTGELSQKINELTQMQNQLILQEKMAGIGQLAAGMAHEINNPLGFVLSNNQVLEKSLRSVKRTISELSEAAARQDCEALVRLTGKAAGANLLFTLEDMSDICRESETGLRRISDIIKALRAFARFDGDAPVGEYNVKDAIQTTLTIASNELKKVGQLECRLADVPNVVAVGSLINQVLLNLIVNAAHAVAAANLGEHGKLTLCTSFDGQWVCVAVSNNGVPIPAEIGEQIYDPFFTTKPAGQGIGIGLSLSYDIIVNRHCGRMSFTSSAEEGTTFFVELPLAFCPARK